MPLPRISEQLFPLLFKRSFFRADGLPQSPHGRAVGPGEHGKTFEVCLCNFSVDLKINKQYTTSFLYGYSPTKGIYII